MIKWHEYTWYSKLAAIVFFIGILPALTFYIGVQYEKTEEVLSNKSVPVPTAVVTYSYIISKDQAEAIARPVLKQCGSLTTSLNTSLVKDQGIETWRVGSNFVSEIKQGFPLTPNPVGVVPEVYVNAQNGDIFERHFTEVGGVPPECE